MPLSEYLVTDDLTILLGLITASIFLLYNLYKPQSLVHPILLGRQSDVARVRMPEESAVHRNYTTGLMGRVSMFILYSSTRSTLSVHSCLT
jgi:long-chain acyl-CoA synthetase